ncbi:HNH endonuclease [Enterobacter asburiae]|uniref:HNH endonuclease signature motif containing protein n=1 Tax=Enterobacter asburiae TaxID=61645 RepID=UPI00192CDD33|nr:HNH endonuclease signature motif containing protein [Enterobacter asburiae]MBL5841150.1 HNH endonuclease [Enterobacter asburiae]
MKESEEALQALKSSFSYDPETGLFTCINPLARRHFGKVAGTKRKDGYVRLGVKIEGKGFYFLAHRVAWAFYYGVWPTYFIDHKDRQKDNNRITNLRDVQKFVNVYNYSRGKKNQTGFRGVFVDKRWTRLRYHAVYSKIHLGTFDSAEEASECYQAYVKTIHDIIVED